MSAIVADECPGCPSEYSLDLSVGAFTVLGTEDEGEVRLFSVTSFKNNELIPSALQFSIKWQFD